MKENFSYEDSGSVFIFSIASLSSSKVINSLIWKNVFLIHNLYKNWFNLRVVQTACASDHYNHYIADLIFNA